MQKGIAVTHLSEPDDQFNDAHVDLEGAHTAPKAQDGFHALDAHATGGGAIVPPPTPVHDGRDEESILADEAAAIAFADDVPAMPEDNVGEMFMDMDVDGNESAAAAETHMSDTLVMAGLIKEIARETAKSFQTNTPPATFMEVNRRPVRDYSLVTRRNFNVAGLDALDLRSLKPNGEPWDFMTRADRREAQRLLRERKPAWVTGAPPCTAFSIWNYAKNSTKMNPDVVRKKLAEGRLHLQCVASLHRIQDAEERYNLHEHPATAMSWKEDVITALARKPNARLVTADQCQYGLVTPSEDDPAKMMPALKPTKFQTNSKLTLEQLQRRCNHQHKHQGLVGGRARDAAFNPAGLVRAMLRGMTLQAEEDHLAVIQGKEEFKKLAAMPMQ